MTLQRSVRVSGLALLCAAVVVASSLATRLNGMRVQTAQTDRPQAPSFRTEANYVRVDVYPTLNGAPIADLRQEDFEVLDNGVRQDIDQFERVEIRPAGP